MSLSKGESKQNDMKLWYKQQMLSIIGPRVMIRDM